MSTAPIEPSHAASRYHKAIDRFRNDGRDWIYIAKATLAALMALRIAMSLDLPQPRTAMTTVFIVMQPQSGMVLAKGFYRLLGTIVGLAVMLLLISLFSQEPVLYLTTVALWMAICTIGAAHYRDFRSYGFAITGYTAVLVGIPAAQHAPDAFMTAMTRLAELSLGIFCATAVSSLVFPQLAGERITEAMQQRFTGFVGHVANVLAGKVDARHIEEVNARFVTEIVSYESSRSAAVFEHPNMRQRSGRFARLNAEFMGMSTRIHAIHRMMERLRAAGACPLLEAVEPLFRQTASLLEAVGGDLQGGRHVKDGAKSVSEFRTGLAAKIAIARMSLHEPTNEDLLEFDTVSELLGRFVDDFTSYVKTYFSLQTPSHERERWAGKFVPKTSILAAVVAGLRTMLLMLVLSVFWIYSGWPSGGMAVLNGGAICALASSSLRPQKTALHMAIGTLIAALFGLVVIFLVYPRAMGFDELCIALTPFLAFGAWLTTRRNYAGYGVGYCIYFCFLVGPDSVIAYSPSTYANDSFAIVVSMFAVWGVFALVMPTTGRWLQNLLLIELRQQIVYACKGHLKNIGVRFESHIRDLFWQLNGTSSGGADMKRKATESFFTSLEIGHAVIDLRIELAGFPRSGSIKASATPLMQEIEDFIDAVSRLFKRPSASKSDAALAATIHAIGSVESALRSTIVSHENRRSMQRAITQPHFIKTVMLDERLSLQRQVDGSQTTVR